MPKYTKPDVLPVEISLDGTEFTDNGITYGFFDAYLLDVHPRLISKLGGTPITLAGFGFVNTGETKAKFQVKGAGDLSCGVSPCTADAAFVDKNTMTTRSVAQGVLSYKNGTNIGMDGFAIEAAVYNNEFTSNNIQVWYIFDPSFKSISRNSTPINLSLPILVQTDFNWAQNDFSRFQKYSNFTCRFTLGNDRYVTAGRMETMPFGSRYENDEITADKQILPTHVLCASPRVQNPGTAVMDISVNGFDFSGAFQYTFTPPVDVYRVSPASGPIDSSTRVKLVGTGILENKDTVIQKTGVYETTSVKNAEIKSMAWSESEFLASMLMTSQDELTFKFVNKPLTPGQAL